LEGKVTRNGKKEGKKGKYRPPFKMEKKGPKGELKREKHDLENSPHFCAGKQYNGAFKRGGRPGVKKKNIQFHKSRRLKRGGPDVNRLKKKKPFLKKWFILKLKKTRRDGREWQLHSWDWAKPQEKAIVNVTGGRPFK